MAVTDSTSEQDRGGASRAGQIVAAYRGVLRNPALVRLLIGEFVSSIGDWLYLVAIMILVYTATESAAWLGIIGAVRILPYVLLSLPAGFAADRFDRRLILIWTDIARGVIMLAIAAMVFFDGPILIVVGLTVLAACFSAFFGPAIGSFLPSLIDDERDLAPANSAWSSLDNLAFVVGPGIAGLLIAAGGMGLAFVLNALTFAFVAVVLWRLPSKGGRDTDGDSDEGQAGSRDVRSLIRPIAAPLSGIALLNVTLGFLFGGLGVLTVILALDVLAGGEEVVGYLSSALGLGGLLGALLAGGLALGQRLALPILGGGVLLGIAIGLLGVTDSTILMLAFFAAAGAGVVVVEVASTTLLQRIVPDVVRGRALGGVETAYVTAYAAGAFSMPFLSGVVGVGPVLVVGAAIFLVSLAGVAFLLGRQAAGSGELDEQQRRFARLPIFSGLSPARLEEAARQLQPVSVHGDDVVVRQGETADRFYYIVNGRFEVTRADAEGEERRLRHLGPGQVFGEIGLLTSAPRTATVRAEEEGELLALDGRAFLRLVAAGRGAGISSRLLDLHRSPAPAGRSLEGVRYEPSA
jgi:MFS family permease